MAFPMARMLANRLAWVSTTPLGLPVLPEVYWMKAISLLFSTGFFANALGVVSSDTVSMCFRQGT